MKKRILLLIISIFIICPAMMIAQSLQIYQVDPSAYPDVKVHFIAKKANGDKLTGTDFSNGDVWVKENGTVKNGTVNCPGPGIRKISVICVCDISTSMGDKVVGNITKLDIAKETLKQWIPNLPQGLFECALMAFHENVYTIVDFTDDKAALYAGLDSDILKVGLQPSDFNSALLYDQRVPLGEGALLVAQKAVNVPYIIILTDGKHNSTSRPEILVDEIKNRVNELGTKIYTITMSSVSELTPSQIDAVTAISDKVYWDKKTPTEISATTYEILNDIQNTPPPCIFTFMTDCNGGGELTLNIDNSFVKATDTVDYTIPSMSKSVLEFGSGFGEPFLNVDPGTKQFKDLNLFAWNNAVVFTSKPEISNKDFQITSPTNWTGLSMKKDDSLAIRVEYTGSTGDSICRETEIEFKSTACSDNSIKMYSGWIFTRPVDFGECEQGVENKLDYTAVFCNQSCSPITVEAAALGGVDFVNFKLKTGELPVVLASGECLDMEFTFKPVTDGMYWATLNVTADGQSYMSSVSGRGKKAVKVNESSNDWCNAGIMLHPNPCSNTLSVTINLSAASDMTISVLNLIGSPVLKEKVNNVLTYNKLYDINSLPVGFYVFRVEAGGKTFERAFLKN